jgi:4-amino-4-deoxy-L-arabinose transferase-like glycosyltransferase
MKKFVLPGIFAFGAILRLFHLTDTWSSPLVKVPIIDSEYYHYWAKALVSGAPGDSGVFFMSPLYPYVLSLFYRLFAAVPEVGLIFQFFLGLITIYLIYLIAKRLFSENVALLSAFIAAVYEPFIYYEGILLSAVIILVLNGIILLLLLDKNRNHLKSITIGILLGLSALARPNILLLAPLLLVYFIANRTHKDFRRPVLILVGLVIVLLPVAYRNYRVGGEWILTTAGAGMNFYVGNNPSATGIYWEAPWIRSAEPQYENEDYRLEASRRIGHDLSVNQASLYWLKEGFLFIVTQPLTFFKLLLIKLFLFFHTTEIPNNLSIYAAREFSRILTLLPLGFGIIAPFGLLAWLKRLRLPQFRIVNVYGLSYLLATLLFFASSEYRIPILLVMIPFAAAGISELLAYIKDKKWGGFLGLLVLVGCVALPLNMPTKFTNKIASSRMDYFNLGSVLLRQNKAADAASMLQRSLFQDPDFTEAHMLLGDAFHALGLYEEAADEFSRAGLDPDHEMSILNAEEAFDDAARKAQLGDFEPAHEKYSEGITLHPDPPAHVYYNMAYLNLQLGDTTKALDEIKIAESLDPNEARIYYFQGWLYENSGDLDSAFQYYTTALQHNYLLHEARARIAWIHLQRNEPEKAAETIEPLVGLNFQNPELQDLIDRVAFAVGF